jgi:hypothetical protein
MLYQIAKILKKQVVEVLKMGYLNDLGCLNFQIDLKGE